jgi:hypothetical protein
VLRGALAGAGALALLGPRGGSAKNNKVQICHHNDNGSWNLIEVSTNAAEAHLGHGDGLLGSQNHCGSCGDMCDSESSCVDGICTANVPSQTPNTSTGTNVSVSLSDGSVSFENVTTPGVTTITPVSSSPAPLPDEFSIDGATFYDVQTTATFSGTATVCLSFDPDSYTNPSQVRLLHFENGNWVDITSGTDSDSVCGQVDSFSPFAIVEPKAQPVECEYDYECPSDSAQCRMGFCDNGACSYKNANAGMLCGSCSECNANGECVQTCGQGEVCCGQDLDTGFSGCCTEDLCNQTTGVCCDSGFFACGPTCCGSNQYCCGSACNDSPCCEANSDCDPCHQCNNGFCEPLCAEHLELCCPDLDEHGRCVDSGQSCSGPICERDLCQELDNGTCVDVCPTHGMVCDGQGACVPPCVPLDGACGDGDTCCGDNVCCDGVCSTLDSTCGGACCGDDQDCCGGYYCVPKGARCCSGSAQCHDLNDCTGDGLKIWHNFTCSPSLGYCVESIEDCSNNDPCNPGMCAWDTGCWQDTRSGVACGDQCCANCCNGACIDESLTCCNSAADCPAIANQIAGCSAEHICVYTSACPGCVGLWDNCDGLRGQSLTACDGCTPVICCYDTAHGYQYPRWTPANISSNYDCTA